jgi:hypothetical protein
MEEFGIFSVVIVFVLLFAGTLRGCVTKDDLENICAHYTTTPEMYRNCIEGRAEKENGK